MGMGGITEDIVVLGSVRMIALTLPGEVAQPPCLPVIPFIGLLCAMQRVSAGGLWDLMPFHC